MDKLFLSKLHLIEEDYKTQEEFLKHPSYIFDFLKNNQLDELLITELNHAGNQFSSLQPMPISRNMRGKLLTGKNYIKKLLMDFTVSMKQFREFYKFNEKTHIINFLLGEKIFIEKKDGNYIRHTVRKYNPQYLEFITKAYCSIKELTNTFTVTLDKTTLLGHSLDGEVAIGHDNCDYVLDKIENITKYITKEKTGQAFFVESIENNAKLYTKEDYKYNNDDSWKKKYIKIYFLG